MNSNINLRNLGLGAICAASMALSLALGNFALAADDHNSSRSNKSNSLQDSPAVEELSATMSEIDTLLDTIVQDIARCNELQAQLNEQHASFVDARASEAETGVEMQQQAAEARRAFDEHVAPFLDPSTIEQVSLNFDKIEMSAISDPDSDDDGLGDMLEAMSSSFSTALSSLESAKSSSSELISTYDLKMAKK
jgi:hypothetical protein